MKRAVLVGSLALFVTSAVAAVAVGCHPAEPKQASSVDPVGDDPAGAASGSTGGSSGGSGRGGDNVMVPPPGGGAPGAQVKGDAPLVSSLAAQLEGLRWGMTRAEVIKTFTENGGLIWKDYDDKLAKARVGPEMTAIENEREQAKQAFARSLVEFKDTPTGYDATGLRGEYTYRNRESVMSVTRHGKKRFFFFFNDRLWKMYDEVPLAESGPMGKSYIDAVNKMNAALAAQGRIQGVDASKGVNATTVDWKDDSSHLRLVDRTGDRVVAVVIEDNVTLSNLAALRPNKAEDPTAIDPTIAAVTNGGLSDPNAAKAAPSSSAPGKRAPAPKKK